MCPCGKAVENRTQVVGVSEIYQEERDVLDEENRRMRHGEEKFGTLLIDSNEETIAVLGDRWWAQTAKEEGDKLNDFFLFNIWKKRNERPNVGGVY